MNHNIFITLNQGSKSLFSQDISIETS